MKKLILYICLLLCIVMPVYGQSVRPSYHQGFAHNASESKRPNLWKGLVGCWKPSLGVTGLTLRDVSGLNNHGTFNNMTIDDWVIGRDGYALSFDGVNQSVNIPAHPNQEVSDITVLIIVKRNGSAGNNNRCFEKEFNNATQTPFVSWGFEWGGASSLKFIIGTSAGITLVSLPGIPDDTYTSLAGTFSKSKDLIQVYTNAVAGNTGSPGGSGIIYSASNKDIHIFGRTGLGEYAPGSFLYGALYNRVLSQNEIRQWHNDPNAMFEFADRFAFRAPAVAPSTRRIMLISQLVNDLISQYQYN